MDSKVPKNVLRKLVKTLIDGGDVITQSGKHPISLTDLSCIVHEYCWPNEVPVQTTAIRYAKLWRRFGIDFLDSHYIAEYNSLKHGFRVSSGGFVLRVGIEEDYGVPPPEENLQTVGASPFGTNFYESIPIFKNDSTKHHFRIKQIALNWRAEAMVQRLNLLSCSINNVVSALRCLNGATPSTVKFVRPENPDEYEAAWNWSVGVTSSNFETIIDVSDESLIDQHALMNELLSRNLDENQALHNLHVR